MMSNPNFLPGAVSQNLTVEVELTISAKNLLNSDVLSKSDPMCIVYIQHQNNPTWIEHGRTEVLKNSLNPEFATKILIAYHFEEIQKINFKIFDIDGSSQILENHDFLGEAECTLGQIVSSTNFVTTLHHSSHRNGGQLCVKAEEIGSLKEEVEFQFNAEGFKRSYFFSKPDPFLAIYKDNTLIHRTPFIKNNCNPQWPKFSLPKRAICAKNGEDAKLLLQSYNYNDNGSHKLLGEISITSRDICSAPNAFNLLNKKTGKVKGKLNLVGAITKRTYSFLDYITAGTQLHCTVAIDFTASNGNPTTFGSLHYMGPTPTLYEQALQSVVTIISDYDSNKQFPVLGFGAKIPPSGELSHEFFVNMTPSPYCSGVGGVIEAYRRCLPLIQLHGPTNFAPVINHVARFASAYPNGDNYFILLILTDGAISDMQDTKEAIINASHLPMSIIIVGIGNANFSSMTELDSDNCVLSVNGRSACRDIVQFVPFRDFLQNADPLFASSELARTLLAEVPAQLINFMKSKNLTPKEAN